MISKDFNSTQNRQALFGVIKETVKTDIQPYQDGILKTMLYVEQNVSQEVPYGISKEDYLIMMNKKVYSIIVPIIQQDQMNKPKQISSSPTPPPRRIDSSFTKSTPKKENFGNRIQPVSRDEMFDPHLMKQYEQIPIAEYPSASQPKVREENMMEQMNRFKSEREILGNQRPKEVKFQLPEDSAPKEMVKNMFEKRVEEYKNQTSSMMHFEKGNEEMNGEIEKIVENRNEYDAIPIDLFGKQTEDFMKSTPYGIDHFENNQQVSESGTRTDLKKHEIEKSYNEEDVMSYGNKEIRRPENSNRFYKDVAYPKEETTLKDTKNLEFSPYLNHFLTSVMLPKPQPTIFKSNKIVISSFFRNKYIYPNQNYFEIKFNPSSEFISVETVIDQNNTIIMRGKNIYNRNSGAYIPISFDNIYKIQLNEVICPVITNYRGGRAPVVYNTATPVPGQTYFSQFDPIPTKSTGIPQGVFKEPFLYLQIPELEHSYYDTSDFGNRCFSKLIPDFGANSGFQSVYTSSFTKLQPVDRDEFYIYNPILRGKLDKFTLSMYNYRGNSYDFGLDKLYIEKFSAGNKRYSGLCGPEYQTTKITIQKTNSNYAEYCKNTSSNLQNGCDTLNSHLVAPGDLLYFFVTTPDCLDDYVPFEKYIQFKSIELVELNGKKYTKIQAYYTKEVEINGEKVLKEFYVNFKQLVPGGLQDNYSFYSQFLLILGYRNGNESELNNFYLYYNIEGFVEDAILLEYKEGLYFYINSLNWKNISFYLSKTIPEGNQNENPQSLYYDKGFNVISVGNFNDINQLETEDTQPFEIEIDFPYDKIPYFFKSEDFRNEYNPGTVFFIQHKLQLFYDFTITCKVKDSSEVNSDIQGNGLNF